MAAALVVSTACTLPEATPAASPAGTPLSGPDLEATVAARVQATVEAPLSATPSPTPTPALPTSASTPTPTATSPEAEEEQLVVECPDPCIWADNLSIEDGKYEFRIGEAEDPLVNLDGLFGYPLGARVPSIFGDGIVIGPMLVGTTFQFGTIRMSGSRSTKDHYFIVRGLENQCREGTEAFPANDACVAGPDIIYKYSLDGTRVEEPWTYTFTVAGEFPITSGTADGDDPPEEHGRAVFLICDQIAEDGKTCADGGGEAAAFDGTYRLGEFVVEDGKFELRMGTTAYFGYDAEARIPTIRGRVAITIGPIRVGETVSFTRCRQSGSRSTEPHHMTVKALRIDHNLDAAFGTGGATVGVADDPTNNCEFTFQAPGEYLIDDDLHPGAHGVAKIVVAGEATGPQPPPTRPAVQLAFREWTPLEGRLIFVNDFIIEDGRFELGISGAEFGHPRGARVSSVVSDGIVMTANVGDTIHFRSGIRLSRTTKPHFFTVEGLDIDIPIAGRCCGPLEITFTKPGEFVIDDSSDPGEHGKARFVVTGKPTTAPLSLSAIAVGDSGRLYVLDDAQVRVFSLEGGTVDTWGAPGRADGEFRGPGGLAVDAGGDVYVADTENHRIQVFRKQRGIFSRPSVIALWGSRGDGEGLFESPAAIAVDANRKVYVADTGNDRVQVFSSTGAFLTSWGRTGTRDGRFRRPQGIAVDQAGDIYVTDRVNNRVQVFSPSGAFSHKWGTEGRADGQFRNPRGIAVGSDGNVYVADTGNDRIQIFSPAGEFLGSWALPPGIGDGQFDGPVGVAVGKTGTVYVADAGNGRIQLFERADTGLTVAPKPAPPRLRPVFVATWGRLGRSDGAFNRPEGIAVGPLGDLYVADTGNERIQIFDAAGDFQSLIEEGLPSDPTDIGVDPLGNVYVTDGPNQQIRVFDARGEPLATWDDVSLPGGIAVDGSGNVYVTDLFAQGVQKYGPDGKLLNEWGRRGNGESQFQNPRGLAVDADGNVYVTDTGNHRVQVFTSAGEFLAQWGTSGTGEGRFDQPTGIAVDKSGRVYVVDTSNHRVQVFTGRGTFLGEWGRRGSDDREFNSPSAIAIDDSGVVYVTDSRNHRIQVFTVGIEGL